jgi:digeranylgeranylglycerophospholipid reductase
MTLVNKNFSKRRFEVSVFDVAVIGASAVGCIAARDCARLGLNTLVLEEHSEPGKQGKCTALYSKRGLESLEVNHAPAVLNKVRGAVFRTPHARLEVSRREPVALVLNRRKLDEACFKQARKAGARILLNNRVTTIVQEKDFVRVSCGKKFFDARVVIAADGASSSTASALGFPKIKEFVLGYEAEFKGVRLLRKDLVQVFLNARVYPGFFAWIVSAGRGVARVGLGVNDFKKLGAAKKALFVEPLVRETLSRAKKTREFTAVIPVAVRGRTQDGRVLLVGDAAGQVKATTGGGVVFGGNCARIAARCAAAFIRGDGRLDYEREWRREFGKELRLHAAIARAKNSLGNSSLDFALAAGRVLGVPLFLKRFGDMDFVLRV